MAYFDMKGLAMKKWLLIATLVVSVFGITQVLAAQVGLEDAYQVVVKGLLQGDRTGEAYLRFAPYDHARHDGRSMAPFDNAPGNIRLSFLRG